jgi:hypothetical protein
VTGVSRSAYAPTAAAIPPLSARKSVDLIVDDFAVQHGERLIRGNQCEVGVESRQVICTSSPEELLGIGGGNRRLVARCGKKLTLVEVTSINEKRAFHFPQRRKHRPIELRESDLDICLGPRKVRMSLRTKTGDRDADLRGHRMEDRFCLRATTVTRVTSYASSPHDPTGKRENSELRRGRKLCLNTTPLILPTTGFAVGSSASDSGISSKEFRCRFL